MEMHRVYVLNFSWNIPEPRQKIIFIDESGLNAIFGEQRRHQKLTHQPMWPCQWLEDECFPNCSNQHSGNGVAWSDWTFLSLQIFSLQLSAGYCRNWMKMIWRMWLVLENVSFHNTQEVCDLGGQTRHTLLFLPPCFPWWIPLKFLQKLSSAWDIFWQILQTMNV